MESSNLAAPSVDRILGNEQAGFQRGLDIHPKNPPPPAAGQSVERYYCVCISTLLISRRRLTRGTKSLWIIMKKYGIPNKLTQMVKALYDDFQCSVIEDNETTSLFSVMIGVKQSCQ